MSKRKARIGSSFDDFLKDEGIYEATQAVAIKRVLAAEKASRVSARSSSFRTRARRRRVVE